MAAMMQDKDCSEETDVMISDLDAFHMNDDGLIAHDDVSTDDDSGLPHVLIITHVPDAVFDSDEAREVFEQLFCAFESSPEVQYLKSFRRARVVFDQPRAATLARVHLHEREVLGNTIKCYFAQPVDAQDSSVASSQYLLPPKPEKQFLISPPSSPPAGWESVNEKQPAINYDLIAAITNLTPGAVHEVHSASGSQPGIVVHVCDDPDGYKTRPQILQTRCPHSATF